jgi:nitronate monooxygenase
MGGYAGPDLATAVSQAGGVGMIGAVDDMDKLDKNLEQVSQDLDRVNGLLPIGVGLIGFITKLDKAVEVLAKHKPAVVWFFAAPQLADYTTYAERMRKALPSSQIWVQVGNVEAALKVAEKTKPDVLCVQGSDAGGHGFEKGAGVISLVPEVADALATAGHKVSLVAAGGVADGRSVAAVLALGAQGAVMGTRFLAAKEVQSHPVYQKAIIAASDGGQSTIRSKLFDNLRGPNIWPEAYDGRSLVMESFEDHQKGMPIEEIRQKHNDALKGQDAGFGVDGKGRAAIWAGTGVGLVKSVQPAGEIVDEVRGKAREVLEGISARL